LLKSDAPAPLRNLMGTPVELLRQLGITGT